MSYVAQGTKASSFWKFLFNITEHSLGNKAVSNNYTFFCSLRIGWPWQTQVQGLTLLTRPQVSRFFWKKKTRSQLGTSGISINLKTHWLSFIGQHRLSNAYSHCWYEYCQFLIDVRLIISWYAFPAIRNLDSATQIITVDFKNICLHWLLADCSGETTKYSYTSLGKCPSLHSKARTKELGGWINIYRHLIISYCVIQLS